MREASLRLPESLKDVRLSLVEIGARWGLPYRWQRLRSQVDLVSVEPDPEEAKHLAAHLEGLGYRSVRVLAMALGASRGTISLNLTKARECSSVFPPNLEFLSRFPDSGRFETEKVIEGIPVARLDEELQRLGISRCDFVRCDVEGYEHEILEGAGTFLDTLLGIEVEVSMQERYLGQRLFHEVAAKLHAKGLVLASLERKWWLRSCASERISSVGQDVFADCLFIRDPVTTEDIDRERLLKSTLVLFVYGHLDWALESFEHGRKLGLVTVSEVAAIRTWLEEHSLLRSRFWRLVASLPKFPFRLRLARAMGLASDIFMGKIYGAHFRTDQAAWNRGWDWTGW